MLKLALAPLASKALLQLTLPVVSPANGIEQVNMGPLFWFAETNDIPAGKASVKVTLVASSGPTFSTSTLNETSVPAAALEGPVFVTRRSAPPSAAA
jgi:hypothetical protein